jgi:two-component system response regulator YesN
VKTSTEIELLLLSIIELFSASIGPILHHEIIRFSGDLVLIVNAASEAQKSSFYKALTLTKNMVADRLDDTLSIGVSGFGHNTSDLHAAYAHALDALEFQYFSGSNAIVSYDEIRAYAINKTFYPLDAERTLLNRIASGQDDGIADQLDDFMNALKQNNASSDQYKKASLALMFSVYHACIENNIDTDPIFGADLSALDVIAAIDKISSLRTQLLGILESAAQRFARIRNVNSYVEMILKFIDEKYADEISLESIASEVFITPGYVSILFKQVLGINFVDYLQKVRSKKACELLADVRLKIYDISCKVGYKDEKYFSQVFRKNIGMTPTEYRKMIQQR